MSDDHRSPEEIQAEIENAQKQQAAWAQRIDKLTTEQMIARTASYDPMTVQNARTLNINPDNFETEAELEKAIEIVTNENQETN